MSFDPELLTFLGLETGADEEAANIALTAIIIAATHDQHPKLNLSEIYHQIVKCNASKFLDPLHVLPLLVESPEPPAKDILSLIGQCSPAKEVLIAAQEGIEKAKLSLETENEDDDEDEKSESKPTSPTQAVIALIEVYTSAIPRLKLRKKSALETVRSYISELREVNIVAGHRISSDDSRNLISTTSRLVEKVHIWIKSNTNEGDHSIIESQKLLRALLENTVSSCANALNSSIAQRTFEELYPRLTIRSSSKPGCEKADEVILEALQAFNSLGQSLYQSPSMASLVLFAYQAPEELNQWTLASLLPILVACLQFNLILDESLAFLLKVLHCHARTAQGQLPDHIVTPLLSLLPILASGHPDPQTRHQAFRIISLILSLSPPLLRFQTLADLTSDSELPQMRIAAVGLVKEAVLEGLSSSSPDAFASPTFMQMFGPILFRPHPPDILDSPLSMQEFEESQEPKRLVECLSLYYVLLLRDRENLTGVRDRDVLESVEHSLLSPLRLKLDSWMSEANVSEAHIHDIMPLVSLQTSLERVDAAKANIQSPVA